MSINVVVFQVITSESRDIWKDAEVQSRQAFPATGNFDLPANAFGRLAVHNDDIVSPGAGFDMHQHDNMEIFTWVAQGLIAHRDSTADPSAQTILHRGMVSYINAGTGIRHAEINADDFTSRSFLRVIQMWILPDKQATQPRYATADVRSQLEKGRLFLLAGPASDSAPIATESDSARLYAGVLADGTREHLKLGDFTHVYVVRGSIDAQITPADGTQPAGTQPAGTLSAEIKPGKAHEPTRESEHEPSRRAVLREGDQLRIVTEKQSTGVDESSAQANGLETSSSHLALTALEPETEILVWKMRR